MMYFMDGLNQEALVSHMSKSIAYDCLLPQQTTDGQDIMMLFLTASIGFLYKKVQLVTSVN